MGRIYDNLRINIDKLNQINEQIRNNEVISMHVVYDAMKAVKKINYVIDYINNNLQENIQIPSRLPNGSNQSFNIPDNFEEMVNGWEENFNEEQLDGVINDLEFEDNIPPLITEIINVDPTAYVDYVHETIEGLSTNSKAKTFGVSEEAFQNLIISIHQDVIKTIIDKDYPIDPNNNAMEFIYDFLEDPFEDILRNHRRDLGLEDREDLNYFKNEAENKFRNIIEHSQHPNPKEESLHHFNMIQSLMIINTANNTPEALADAVKNAISNYETHRFNHNNAPSIGEFIYYAKDRLERKIFDRCVSLNDDSNSIFLRKFLVNPINAMEEYYASLDNNRINVLNNEMAEYRRLNEGKPDRWKDFETERRNLFNTYVSERMPSFNRETIEKEYRGGFFERTFNRTSNEWKNVAKFLKGWENDGHNKGNLMMASNLATKYVQHKFPNVNIEDITEDMIARLSPVAAGRLTVCFAIIDSAERANAETWNRHIDEANNRMDEYFRIVNRNPNNEFQNQLNIDVSMENANNNIINNENNIENEINNQNNVIDNNENEM